MTTPNVNLRGIDPAHIWLVCNQAAPGRDASALALLVRGGHGARVILSDRAAARAALDALTRVGYDVIRDDRRELIVQGWSGDGLESRLAAMREVIYKLAAAPGAIAVAALDELDGVLGAGLPPVTTEQQCLRRAERELRTWISRTSGFHAPCDPVTRPADAGIALRLSATRRAEDAIEDLAGRQVQVAEFAVALYPDLRRQMSHEGARDSAIRRASLAFHIRGRLDRDTTVLMPGGATSPVPGTTAAWPGAPPECRALPDGETTRIFPAPGSAARPPSATAHGLRGRNFPSGPAGHTSRGGLSRGS